MGESDKPLAATAATLEERLAENKANQEESRAEKGTEVLMRALQTLGFLLHVLRNLFP